MSVPHDDFVTGAIHGHGEGEPCTSACIVPPVYGWDDLAKDLALTTPLTLSQAFNMTYPLREIPKAEPYEILRPLQTLAKYLRFTEDGQAALYAERLRDLLTTTEVP